MGDISLRRAIDEYESIYLASRNFVQRTREIYLSDLENLIRFLLQLGLQKVDDIELPQLQRYLAHLDHRGLAGSTRKRKVVAIRSFLWYLYQARYLRTNLAKRLIPPFAAPQSPRFLTRAEYTKVLEAASHNRRDFALIQLLLQTGIKLSEVTRLRVTDLELDSGKDNFGRLFIRAGERRSERIVELNQKARIALEWYVRQRSPANDSALFINRFGQPLSVRGVEKVVKMYLTQAGTLNASVQTLRNTFGIYQAEKGTSPETIRKIMGHKLLRSTDIYFFKRTYIHEK